MLTNKIDALRKKKVLSYNVIAQRAGFTPTYICQLAKGKRSNPSLEAMQKIARALEEKVEKVFRIN